MLLRSSLFIALSLGLLSIVIGCADSGSPITDKAASPAATVTLANAVCPMMDDVAKEDITVEWNGKTVGFCCRDCIPEWNSLTEEEKTAKFAAAMEKRVEDLPHDVKHEHSHHKGH